MKKYLFAALIAAVCVSAAACTASPAEVPDDNAGTEQSIAAEESETASEAEDAALPEEDEAGTSAEEPEEEVPAEDSEEDADPDKAWKDTYAAALWIYASGELYTSECRFSLAYIDEDDIPELLIHQGSDHACGVEIYAYLDGGLVNVSTEDTPAAFGVYGSLSYAEKGNRIASNYRAMGEHTCDMYTLDDRHAAVLTRSYFDNEDNADEASVYQIDGADVSAEEYHTAFDADNADLALADYENAYEFTSENYVALF